MNMIPFERSFASHEKSPFLSNKNIDDYGDIINPRNIFRSSSKKFLFTCNVCLHDFESQLDNIIKGQWCPYCSNPPKKLCTNEYCQTCFDRSFASHEKSLFLSNKNIDDNGEIINPRNIFRSSSKKFLFTCNVCLHDFESQLDNIIKGQWCPYCSNPPKKLCTNEYCQTCFESSFASHEKSLFLSNKNIDARQIFKGSNIKLQFLCNNCNHIFEQSPNAITYIHKMSWCPYCSNPPQKLCEKDCDYCYRKSFASHEKAMMWSPNNKILPIHVFKCSGKLYLFYCNECNVDFKMTPANVINGEWCPLCINKTEKKLYNKIQPIYNTIICQYKQNWCKGKRCLPFDFCIPEYKIIIELDGPQHFRQISNWSSPEKQFETDKYKEKCANINGYSVIRLLQEDVLYDKYDWIKELCNTISEIINDPSITAVYLSMNNDYHLY